MMKRLALLLLALTFASQGWGQATRPGMQMDRIQPKGVAGDVLVSGYATAGSGTSESPYTGWDSAITWAANTTYKFTGSRGAQTFYAWSSALPNLALSGIRISCEPGVILQWNGAGDAFLFDGYAAAGNSNLGVGNVTFEGCVVNGTASATNGAHIKDTHRSTFSHLRFLNLTGSGIQVNGGVANSYDYLTVSNQNLPTGITQTTTPAHCISISDDGVASTAGTASTIYKPVCEATAGQGIYLLHGAIPNGTTSLQVIQGTVENNTGVNGHGIECDAATEVTINGTDIEGNSQRAILDNGCGALKIEALYGVGTCEFQTNGLNGETEMHGGFCDSILVDNTFKGLVLNDTGFNASGSGTYTNNAPSSNPTTQFRLYNIGAGAYVDDLFPNNISFNGGQTIGGGTAAGFFAIDGGVIGGTASSQITLTGPSNASPSNIFLNGANITFRDVNANNKATISTATGAGIFNGLLTGAGLVASGTSLITPGQTVVGSLPSAASNPGAMILVTDSTAVASEGQTCAGSSTNKAVAVSNGSVWKCF